MSAPPTTRRRRVPWLALGLFAAGASSSVALFGNLRHHSERERLATFEVAAEQAAAQVQQRLDRTAAQLASLRGLFLATYEVEPSEWSAFVRTTGWTPPPDELLGFAVVERLKLAGVDAWRVTHRSGQEPEHWRELRAEVPAFEPSPELVELLERTSSSGAPACAEVRCEERGEGVVLAFAIDSPGRRPAPRVRSWLAAELELDTLLTASQEHTPHGLAFELAGSDADLPVTDGAWRADERLRYARPIRLADRSWLLVASGADTAPWLRGVPYLAWFGLASGLALSIAAALLCWSFTRTHQRAQSLADGMVRSRHEITAGVPGVVYDLVRTAPERYCFEFVSEGWEALFGEAPPTAPFGSEQLLERVAPGDRPGLLRSLEESAGSGRPWRHEFRLVCDGGERRWVRGQADQAVDARGRVRWRGVLLDVGDLVASRRREAALSHIVEESVDEVYVFDRDTFEVVYANGAALRNLQREVDEVIGRDATMLCESFDRESLAEAVRPLVDGEVDELELSSVHRRTDGTTYPVEAQLQRSRYGDRDTLVAMAIDVSARRAAERALAESEERFDRAVRGSSDGFWDWIVDTDEAWFSPRFQELLGYIPGAFPARFEGWVEALHPDDREHVVERLRTTIDSGLPFEANYRLRTAHGEYRWYRARARSSAAEDDSQLRLSGSIADITDQVRAERALRESEERLSTALAGAGAGVWVWDIAEDRLEWDPQMHALFGTDPESFSGRMEPSLATHHPEDVARVERELREAIEELRPFSIEYRIVLPEGVVRHVASRGEVHRDESGQPRRIVGICWDVSEAQRQRDTLRRQEALLDQTQSLAHIGGWELDLRDDSLYWTSEVFRIHEVQDGFAPTLEGSFAFYEPEAVPRLRDALRCAREEGVPFDLELPFRTATGRPLWVRALGQPQREGGEVVRVSGAFQDVTDRKHAELELERTRDEAELANRTKSEFLANMSHEIRTPMTAILGFADLLEESDVDEGARLSHVSTIRRNGEHLLAIINDILDLSKIEAGRMEPEFRPTDPVAVADEVVDLLRVRAEEQGIELERRVQGELPGSIQSDPVKLRQILVNLIGNAIKFTPEGSVVVALRAAEVGGEPGVAIDVDDTGIGIPLERRSQLFRPFAQIDSSTARSFGGTGLGLAISSRLARMLGGDIDCRSTIGLGSRFTVTLAARPAADRPQPAARVAAAAEGPEVDPPGADDPLEGARVLLAEDGLDNQRLISLHLRRVGATVDLAADGAEAVEAVRAAAADGPPYDLALMDMQMPAVDGYEATRRLREQGHGLPVVALTAHAMAGDRERCLAVGCDDYATKPIDRDELLAVCRRWIRRGRERTRVA